MPEKNSFNMAKKIIYIDKKVCKNYPNFYIIRVSLCRSWVYATIIRGGKMNAIEEIKKAIYAKYPMVYIVSWEEKRVEDLLNSFSRTAFQEDLYVWSSTEGLKQAGRKIPDTEDILKALSFVANTEKGFFLFKDVYTFMNDPRVARKFRDTYFYIKNRPVRVFVISSILKLPEELKRHFTIIDYELPTFDELFSLVNTFIKEAQKRGVIIQLKSQDLSQMAIALQGFTMDEASFALSKVLHKRQTVDASIIDLLKEEKKQIMRKEGVLEYITDKLSIDDIGGLDNLKDWLIKRKRAFSPEARKYGLDPPRGLLVMGITGCGKSISIKSIATLWELPLFRLDMNLVYSGIAGQPEEAFVRALKVVESAAPAVLWLDEIESGITDKYTADSTARILGYFLTWMQEHRGGVFVGATANRIDMLPAELLRRGRFDQIFFVDLPGRREREEIFRVHFKKRGINPDKFNLPQLAQITKGWSGSEIEQAIISAMYEAFNENREMNEDDLYRIFTNSVPLSTTMAEQIKKIRSWAHDRAVRASSEKPEI